MATPTSEAGLEALNLLKSTDPPPWLAPNPSLAKAAPTASQHLFSALKPFTPKAPFDHLLVDGFDAEQIWQQIDLQSQPVLASIRRDLKQFERNPKEISRLKLAVEEVRKVIEDREGDLKEERDSFDDDMDLFDEEDNDEDDDDKEDDKEEEERRWDEEGSESEDEEGEKESGDGIEDGFLKIKELQEFLDEDEAREYGLDKTKGMENKKKKGDEDGESDDEDEEDEENEENDELGVFGIGNDEDEDGGLLENARYEDFFGSEKKKTVGRKTKLLDESEDSDMDGEHDDDEAFENQEEYVQKTNTAAAPSSLSDETKKEASMLFKKLCLKLDALSHFYFTPKPVIQDMSVQVNVPALAMEEIAPVAVSDAAMLAPEEVFTGKGDIKEEAELTQSERKRRRANKKRRHKVMTTKKVAKKARDSTLPKHGDANAV